MLQLGVLSTRWYLCDDSKPVYDAARQAGQGRQALLDAGTDRLYFADTILQASSFSAPGGLQKHLRNVLSLPDANFEVKVPRSYDDWAPGADLRPDLGEQLAVMTCDQAGSAVAALIFHCVCAANRTCAAAWGGEVVLGRGAC
jgi:hypothetical protein